MNPFTLVGGSADQDARDRTSLHLPLNPSPDGVVFGSLDPLVFSLVAETGSLFADKGSGLSYLIDAPDIVVIEAEEHGSGHHRAPVRPTAARRSAIAEATKG